MLLQWAGKLSGIPVGVSSYRHYWNPFIRTFRTLMAKFKGPYHDAVCCKPEPGAMPVLLSRDQFAEEFVVALRKKAPSVQILVVKDLELKMVAQDGKESQGFLNNAYTQYMTTPESKEDILGKYVGAFSDTTKGMDEPGDRTRIVPILKDKAWIQEANRQAAAIGTCKGFDSVHEVYNEELVVFYAEDTPTNIRYLTAGTLAALDLEMEDLRKLACDNLQRLLPIPDIQEQG